MNDGIERAGSLPPLSEVPLKQGRTLGELVDAYAVGCDLARLRNYAGMTPSGILDAMGSIWTEKDRTYPKALGEALVRAGLDPDVEAVRNSAIEGIWKFYNPCPWFVIRSSATTKH